jgi:hypothetical protein
MGLQAVLAVVAVGSAIDSRNRSKDAEAKAEERAAVDRAVAADSAARKRRQQIREQNLARSRIENMAAAQGMQGGSAVIAASADVVSQSSENIGLINNTLASNQLSANLERDIFKLQQPSGFQQAAGVVTSIGSNYLMHKNTKKK